MFVYCNQEPDIKETIRTLKIRIAKSLFSKCLIGRRSTFDIAHTLLTTNLLIKAKKKYATFTYTKINSFIYD